MSIYRSWGYSPKIKQRAVRPAWREFEIGSYEGSLLPYGNGRSYGDSCLNTQGQVVDGRLLNKFISFDAARGVLRCEAGITFEDILELIVPRGWFLPVTPGTKFVTLGGAVANDVHGKNHHRDGTLGQHILSFELLRSSGERLLCSSDNNAEYFNATIGGLGLTGFITWVEIKLIPIKSSCLDVETITFKGLAEFLELSEESHDGFQYTVAWLDCVSGGNNFARGVFMRANHSEEAVGIGKNPVKRNISVPLSLPSWVVNKYSISIFNSLYYSQQKRISNKNTVKYYDSFFYPLDGVNNWNRIYGKDGFYQYQFVVPKNNTKVLEKILRVIIASGLGSFLAVLKEFGDIKSPGMMSFPKPGICLALDFSNRGKYTLQVLKQLDDYVMDAGGSVYPAKDNRMSSKAFKSYFPTCEVFADYIDPQFTSDFWERVYNER